MRYKSEWRRHKKKRVWMVLIQWKGLLTEEATWEDYDEIVERFPEFILEGKDVLEDRGNVEDGPRRSARLLFFYLLSFLFGLELLFYLVCFLGICFLLWLGISDLFPSLVCECKQE
ncbi:hypothetical protein ACOSQ2_005767 [Xanthoceras sorbifolium]